MIRVIQKGGYRVAVHDPINADGSDAANVLELCAAAARNGSGDAVDLAIVRSAVEARGAVPFAQGSWSGPSPERKYAVAELRRLPDNRELRVARGDLDGVLTLAGASEARRSEARHAVAALRDEGYVPVGVATSGADGRWRFEGIVPVRVTRTRPALRDAPYDFRYVHVWDWQLRVLHWSWAILLALLAITGLMISEAWFLGGGNLTHGFAFGWIRLVHYVSGWLLVAVLLLRAAGLFFGTTRYERWNALTPLSFRSLRDAFVTAKNYLLFQSWKSPSYIGHNPLQQWSYTGVLLLLVGMVVTGFAMYAMYEPRNWFFQWFMPLNDWIGNANVRLLHTVGMWILLLFVPAHIYLSVLSANVDRSGTISSMVDGGRWLRRGIKFVDEE